MQRCPGIAHWQFLILSSAYQLDPPFTESAWYHKMWRSVAMFGSKQGLGGVSLFCPFNLLQVVDNGNGGDKDMAFCIKFSWRLLIFMTFHLVGWFPTLHIRVKWVLFDRLPLFSSHWHVTNSSHCLRRSLFPRKAATDIMELGHLKGSVRKNWSSQPPNQEQSCGATRRSHLAGNVQWIITNQTLLSHSMVEKGVMVMLTQRW